MYTRIRHQVTLVDTTSGQWSISVSSTVFDDTLEVDEDIHLYSAWTFEGSLELALEAVPVLVRVAHHEVAARRP